MGGVVSSTADVLAIIGGTTTLILGIFGAVRYSRCRSVSCCWGACRLTNAPPGEEKDTRPTHLTFGPHPKRRTTDESAPATDGPGPSGASGPVEVMSMSSSSTSTWNGAPHNSLGAPASPASGAPASSASPASCTMGASTLGASEPDYGPQGEFDIQHV